MHDLTQTGFKGPDASPLGVCSCVSHPLAYAPHPSVPAFHSSVEHVSPNAVSITHRLPPYPFNSHPFRPVFLPPDISIYPPPPVTQPCTRFPPVLHHNVFPVFQYRSFEPPGSPSLSEHEASLNRGQLPLNHFSNCGNLSPNRGCTCQKMVPFKYVGKNAFFNDSYHAPVYPPYNFFPYSVYSSPPALPNMCCINGNSLQIERSPSPRRDYNSTRFLSPPVLHTSCSPRLFHSNNFSPHDRSFLTPPRPHSMKRTNSYLSLSPTPSPPSSPRNSPCDRVFVHCQRHGNSKDQNLSNSSNSPLPHSKSLSKQGSNTESLEAPYSKMNKPPALWLARQRLPSREIPDVLSPNTPKLVSHSAPFRLNLK